MSKSKILFIMSGSIACYKACQVLSKLSQAGHEVQVVATPSALQFVGHSTIEGLTGRPVVSDLFTPGQIMDHIHLVRWSDLIVVAPATAHFMNKMAYGLGDDLASTLFLAHDFTKPFLVAPAMNTAMYKHPTTQESLKKLLAMGVQVLESASGILACGETGFGRLLEPDQILMAIDSALQGPSEKKRIDPPIKAQDEGTEKKPVKILVTAGGTQEKIDDVRVISNTSTGRTGYKIAHHLFEAGFDVELLHSKNSQIPNFEDIPVHHFSTYQDLDHELRRLLFEKNFTHVIHTAAVSDFSVDSVRSESGEVREGKIDSSQSLTIKLKSNPKIINHLKEYSKNPSLKVIGFKLTSHLSASEAIQKVEKLLQVADYVVHNDLKEIEANYHRFTLWGLKKPRVYENVEQLSVGLIHAISTEVKT